VTDTNWRPVVAALLGGWPTHRLDAEQSAAFCAELKARLIEPAEALDALRQSRDQFPPSAGTVAAMVDIARQGPAPGWREANRLIARHVTLLPYHDPASGWPAFIATLSSHHEAVARFAVGLGIRGVREKPDPDYVQEDTGQSVALTHLEREYQQTTVGWRSDPRRGVALEEARRQALPRGDRGALGDVVEGLRPAAQLEQGAAA